MTYESARRSGVFTFDSVALFNGWEWSDASTVVIEGGRILEVRDATTAPPSRGNTIHSRGDKIHGDFTLLPGFIDSHVHLGFFDPRTVLAGGVTTARDLAWPIEDIFDLQGKLSQDATAGPNLLVAGPMLTAPGGYPTRAAWAPRGTGLEISSPEHVAAAVEKLANLGASVIKVAQEPAAGPVLAPDLLRAVVDEASPRGLRVTSHIGSLEQLEIAIESGVTEMAHGLMSDERIPDSLIEFMVKIGMTVVPTLHIAPTRNRIDNVGRFSEAGGKLVYGTDMGNAGPPPGIDAEELSLMLNCGLSTDAVLASATSGAAVHLKLEGRGMVAPGRVADLVVVQGDVRKDLQRLSKPHMVLRGGHPV